MHATPSPWHRLGLRWNPFGEPPAADIAALIVPAEACAVAEWLRGPRRAQQYLGDAGRGKTARLYWLAACFPEAPYVYVAEAGPQPKIPLRSPMPEPVALLLDEAQRLPPRRRRRLFAMIAAQGRSLVVASHLDLSAELQAAGLSCRTHRISGLDANQLTAIVRRRIAWAQLPQQSPTLLTDPEAERLIEHFGDDLRAILDHLYEGYQRAATHHETLPCLTVN